jgi:glycolate oxidase FAD binding subunit
VEGFEAAVARQLRDLAALADEAGLASEALRQEPHRRLWEEIGDFGANGEGVLYRVTVPVGAVAEILATIDRWSGEAATPARYVAHAGTGTVWLLAGNDPSSLGWFPRLIALAQGHKGHVVVAAAPPELKAGIDVWGPAPASLGLMREIKRRFDPQEILNPGRFLGGL